MAEWTTLKSSTSLRKGKISTENSLFPLLLGVLLARGNVVGIHPFGIALGAAFLLKGGTGYLFGLLGIAMGTLSYAKWSSTLQIVLIQLALAVFLPYLRKRKKAGLYLAIATTLTTGLISGVILVLGRYNPSDILTVILLSTLAGAFAPIYWFAMSNQAALWDGEFTREQGIAWLLLLVGALGGLQGVQVAEINLQIIVLSFFVLFVSQRFGSGTAAGVGALLGFLPQLSFDVQNLMSAGLFGLAGFCTGAFQRFGKIGIGIAFSAVTLMLTVFLRPDTVYSQVVSSALGLLLFLIWPGITPSKNFLKPKPAPELENMVNKVKAMAEVFDQIAMSCQAAEAETADSRPEMTDLINVLVQRVCHNCPTLNVCWEREFYKTYHYMVDFFALVENKGEINPADLPLNWKRQCGKVKEMLIGIQFIMEQQKSQEAWRRRLALNQEALTHQFQSVSQVIGHLAKELHARHNWEEGKTSGLARRRRHFLDVGVASFNKTGNALSGDNYASLAFSPTEHAFILSDGMGVGEGAAKLSATALTLLEQLLNTGFEPERAVQALNSILVLRSPEETFVTVDMAILDLETEGLKLVKVGASPSYIRSGEGVEALESSSLPAGILNQIDIPVIEAELQVGDMLVLVTDGVHDVLKDGTNWLKGFIERTKAEKSQDLAESIVQEVRRLSHGQLDDDGVVLVVRKNFWMES